jgi:hypothetical protein
MSDDQEFDESLEILLASGVDVPTAIEAAKREPPQAEPPKSGCLGVFVFVAVVFAYTVLR